MTKVSASNFCLASRMDLPRLEAIRKAAFRPVFASFREILGDVIYETAQKQEDEAQEAMLVSLFDSDSIWTTWKAELENKIVGFVSIRFDEATRVGEIGLNAVDPAFGGKGIGTAMYEFALKEMKSRGMKVATVATGGDPSHLPARKAYRKAGFDVEIPSVWMCKDLTDGSMEQ